MSICRDPAAALAAILLLAASGTGAAESDSATESAEDARESAQRNPPLGEATRHPVRESVLVLGSRERRPVPLDAAVRTGSLLDIPARDLPASVSLVSQETIQLRGARTALEAIGAAVGMSGGTSVGSIPNYATRGFTGNDITVMRDGIRQNTNSQSSRPLDAFLFDRIEVLKGPASLLYGEGAIGGAVNYVSKTPDRAPRGEVLLSAGAWDAYRAGLGLGGPTGIDGLYFRADASHSRSDGYVDRSGDEYSAFAGSLLWETGPHSSVTLSSTYLKDDTRSYYGTPVVYDAVIGADGVAAVRKAAVATDRLVNARIEPGTRRLNYNNTDNFARAENSFTRLIFETRLSEHWSLRNETYAATQRFDWRNTESTVWNPVTQLVDRGSFFLIYRDDLQLGNRLDLSWHSQIAGRPNKLVIGGLYDDNYQRRNSGQTYPGAPLPASVPLLDFDPGMGPDAAAEKTLRIRTRTAALYVENLFEATESLKLVGGLRYDSIDLDRLSFLGAAPFEKSYSPVTGRIGAVYAITPAVNVYASYSRAAQPVSQLVSLTATQADFSLQKGRQYEAGVKGSFAQGRVDATLALFDIEKNDLLTSTVVDNVIFNSQIGAQVSQGAELASTLSLGRGWRVDGNLAWTWKAQYEDFNETVSGGLLSRTGNTPPNVPEWIAGIFLARDFGALSATAGVRYVGERQANNNNGIQLDAYTTVDASISYRRERLSLTLRGRNLTDETYAEWASGGGLMLRLADPRSAEIGMHYGF